jgi:uncharacterized coiled-coil protein SlyX
MTKKKSYKHMDKTSGQMAAFLDRMRDMNKKRAAQAARGRNKPPRGGFR